MRQLLLSSVLFCAASLAQAQDAALIVGITDYAALPDVTGGIEVAQAGAALNTAGFRVFGSGNGATDSTAVQGQGNAFAALSPDADRMVVVLAGQFVNDGTRSWLLTADSPQPAPFTVGQRSLSVETAMMLLAQTPGSAVLVLGEQDSDADIAGPGLLSGIGDLTIPSGVTVVRGDVAAARNLLRDVIAVPGGDVIAAVRKSKSLTASGFVPGRLVLVPSGQTPSAPVPQATNDVVTGVTADLATMFEGSAWEQARKTDTQASYAAYLDRFPDGANAGDAVARLQALRDPNLALKQAEDDLKLPVEARRAVQRNLQVLGFDTRGIDGIFGPGTRGAIKTWQGQNNTAQTGYLTADTIGRINDQAARRAAELELQAEQRRAANRAADRTDWERTGATGTAAGLREYLEKHPDGQFAPQAIAALQQIQAQTRNTAQAEDRASWDRARQADNAAAYKAYLDRPGDGAFEAEAQARLADLTAQNGRQAEQAAAAATERQLALDPISLRLVESRLQQLGLQPGAVDGRIDADTRGAIRRYQRDRQLTASGYLDQATVSQMLTDAFR
ncbi:peptidoglycan-binding domain-containing protein [Loktanella salsilacus]|uniref:peptidoglycan-binding domain-containing protein n=1 Tax=Loktanella salsilacus TaxID=195913 RepID=UPI0030013134